MDRILFSRKPKPERERKPERNKEIPSYDGPDLISCLPDGVLGAIVTLLKPEEGARTAVLSRSWRPVWRSAPLNLDDSFSGVVYEEDRIRVISQILAAHPGPVRHLATTNIQLDDNIRIYDDWLCLTVFDALQDLVLHFTLNGLRPDELPASALRFASLRVLDLRGCSFPSGCGTLAFPCLTYLSLRYVDITEELLQRMISNSPGIESLVLHANSGHRRLRLSLSRLRYLAVSVSPMPSSNVLTDLVVEDAASLERLLLHAMETGYLATGFPIVALNDKSIFKSMVPVSLVERFSTVKILALQMPELPKLEVVIAYLRCFPCLEKLKIKFYCYTSWKTTGPKDAVHCDPSAPVECLDHSLKTIVYRREVTG
ncbi:F-box/FBD/LRR-repeat protein At1g13570-like [Miscanthus floridulus]|uniref:F-box/FBD/LRR-repeat protein At1g13570-like n=1 Tax=Miscanthus floridulus TaxID=154761 RepID=UPI0034577DD7